MIVMQSSVWGPLAATSGEVVRKSIGDVTLWVQSLGDEWLIAHEFRNPAVATGDDDDAGIAEPEWVRFVASQDDLVGTQPALPDRPVVIRPLSPIVILPGHWGKFYFSVPLWVRFVSSSGGREQTMTEMPTRDLSSSWFGDMQTGELCYSIGSRLLRGVPETDADDAFARCEIEIRNGSRERLEFERICVHVEHMRLYAAAGRFWSNPVRVVFKGSEQVSQLSYLAGPPSAAPGAGVVCEPREILDMNIFKRSFNLIREMTGI